MMTLAKLAERLTPLSRRTVQLWADEGVLQCLKGTGLGTDAPRLFDAGELRIAKVLREMLFSRAGTPALAAIAKALRLGKVRDALERAENGEPAWLAVIVSQDTAFEPQAEAFAGGDLQKLVERVARSMGSCDMRIIDLKERLHG